jgi:hypothetical protein
LWDSIELEMMHFLEFSMKMLKKIKGKTSFSKVSNLLLAWM